MCPVSSVGNLVLVPSIILVQYTILELVQKCGCSGIDYCLSVTLTDLGRECRVQRAISRIGPPPARQAAERPRGRSARSLSRLGRSRGHTNYNTDYGPIAINSHR